MERTERFCVESEGIKNMRAGQSTDSIRVCFRNESYDEEQDISQQPDLDSKALQPTLSKRTLKYFASPKPTFKSQLALVPDEERKLDRLSAYQGVNKHVRFIVKILYDMLDNMLNADSLNANTAAFSELFDSSGSTFSCAGSSTIARQFGQEKIRSKICSQVSGRKSSIIKNSVDTNNELQNSCNTKSLTATSSQKPFQKDVASSANLGVFKSSLLLTKDGKDDEQRHEVCRKNLIKGKDTDLKNELGKLLSLHKAQTEEPVSNVSFITDACDDDTKKVSCHNQTEKQKERHF